MDLTSYKNRLNANSVGEAFINDTVSIINNSFKNSPSYKIVKINDLEEDCQIKTTSKSNIFKIFLRPYKKIEIGYYVEVNDSKYLVTKSIKNDVYPKAEITLCNNTLIWRDDSNTILKYPCVIEGDILEIDDTRMIKDERLIVRSISEMIIKVPFNSDTNKIKSNDKFIFHDATFEVVGMDKVTDVVNGQGIIKLIVKTVSSNVETVEDIEEDEKVYEDNNSGWGEW